MTPPSRSSRVRRAEAASLDSSTLYELLRLRTDVFVVEQRCPYPELDGRDLEPTSVHLWIDDGGDPPTILGCLRVLADDGGWFRIGRVVTRASARGTGIAGELLTSALASVDGPIRIEAQAHLTDWYGSFGFELAGPAFLEDGIPHVPMTREPNRAQQPATGSSQ